MTSVLTQPPEVSVELLNDRFGKRLQLLLLFFGQAEQIRANIDKVFSPLKNLTPKWKRLNKQVCGRGLIFGD